MNEDCLKLTTYFGERDRAGGAFLADALVDLYARHDLETSVVLRGIEGFGVKHHLQTSRLLTLSEDLPIITVGVDTKERVGGAVAEVRELATHGLITLERARMITRATPPGGLPRELGDGTKLTLYLGRHERAGGRPAYVAVVDLLHRFGIAGATVLLGVDGTAHGERRRASFFGRNAHVPLMIISIGDGPAIERALPELRALLPRPLLTLEQVRICKRDGAKLAEPRHVPRTDPSGLGIWQKLMVYTSEQSQHDGAPVHVGLIRELRRSGAMGATALRGFWGYHGDHAPHGDRVWSIRRRVPVVTVVVDTPERIRRSFEIVDRFTEQTGLVTDELVPAFHAASAQGVNGGLELAAL